MQNSLRTGLIALAIASQGFVAAANAGDDLQWLEDPHGTRALEWAREATQQTKARLSALPSHAALRSALDTVLAQPPVEADRFLLGTRAARVFRDAAHPYGLLQTSPRDASGATGEWTTVLDVAALREKEGIPFELQAYDMGNSCLAPAYVRCLLRLSPAGGDEVEIREFDLAKADFVDAGFRVPKTRAFANWMGEDRILVAHALGDAPKTIAGWPVAYQIWSRGQPLANAKTVFEGQPSDAIIQANVVQTGDGPIAVITRAIDYSTFASTVVDAAGETHDVPLPQKLKPFGVLATTDRHILVQLAEDAQVEGKPYKAEALLAYDVDPSTPADRRVTQVYAPAAGEFLDSALSGVASDGSHVYVVLNRDLRQRVMAFEYTASGWQGRDVFEAAPGDSVTVSSGAHDGGGVMSAVAGFVTPRTQSVQKADGARQLLAQDPALIDSSRFVSEVGTATSKDGTVVDYFLLRPRSPAKGPYPLLMTGYGAFGLSFRPGYFDGVVGGPALKLWLEKGGALAIPAIRGGGERGAAWHQAAIREQRQNSYDDFIAVAEHLIDSGVSAKGHVGVFGMSNGGLLAATLGTQRPDLFSAIVSDVPLTDLIRMRHMGMGAAWMNEYGDPDVPAQAQAMLGYSPYQNVRSGTDYSPFLVTISTEDNRVGPGHARKFAHRLMDVGAPTYFYEDEEGGHGVSDALRNPELMALRMSFLIDTLMTPKN